MVLPSRLRSALAGVRALSASRALQHAGTRWALTACVIAVPSVFTVILVSTLFGSSLADYRPEGILDLHSNFNIQWSDEVYYWHEIASLVEHGLDRGHYTFDELLSPLDSRWGAHGPAFVAFYATLGRLFGWELWSGPVFNLALVALASALCLCLARPRPGERLFLLALVTVFWPLHLFTGSTMQESVHHALAILLAPLVARGLQGSPPGRAGTVAAFVAVGLSGLARPTWLSPFLGLLAIAALQRRTVRRWATLGAGLGWAMGIYLLARLTTSPYPLGAVHSTTESAARSGLAAVPQILGNIALSAAWIWQQRGALPLVDLQRLQVAAVVLLAVGAWSWRLLGAPSGAHAPAAPSRAEALFHVVNLGVPVLTVLAFLHVDGFKDLRVLAPHLLLSTAVAILMRRRLLPGVVLASSLVCTPAFVELYAAFHLSHYVHEPSISERFEREVASHVVHVPGADPWCNTLLAGVHRAPFLISIRPGIGLSMYFHLQELRMPPRSRWVLTPVGTSPPGDQPYERVSASSLGWLYMNKALRCP